MISIYFQPLNTLFLSPHKCAQCVHSILALIHFNPDVVEDSTQCQRMLSVRTLYATFRRRRVEPLH